MAYSKFRSGRFGSALAVLLLGCTAISGTAQAGWLFGESKKEAAETKAEAVKAAAAAPAETLDGSIRQAQLLRVDGNYSEAIRHLSQLMMIASDDGRVISEYGKTLAAMGRESHCRRFFPDPAAPATWRGRKTSYFDLACPLEKFYHIDYIGIFLKIG